MENEFTLPPAPRGLCFDCNDFVKRNFSVDTFLAEHQNAASLDTMRDDLGVYLKVLRIAMIELINKDYANFVNLSATLIGFDKAIDKLQMPLAQINEELLSVKQCLADTMKEISMWLKQRHSLQKKKLILKYYGSTINCFNTLENILKEIAKVEKHKQVSLVERAAMQFNQLTFSVSKCDKLLNPKQRGQYKDIDAKLTQTLNDLFFLTLRTNDEINLLKVLMTLNFVDKVPETETLIRKQVIAPLLQDIINEPSLQKNKEGLQGIYDKIINLLETKLKLLFMVMQHSKLLFFIKKYNFIVNCFWCEVEARLEVNLASIFAPGNPQIFYKRYNESIKFIKKLETYCLDGEMIKQMHETVEYKNFERRWNLPVYFQIRFQEIAGSFEAVLLTVPVVEKNEGFILKETHRCWQALHECWSDGIFIEALTHKFWKLSLQILSRYAIWANSYCSLETYKTVDGNINQTLIDNCINIYIDTQALLFRLPHFIQSIEKKVQIKEGNLLRQSLLPSRQALDKVIQNIKERFIIELYEYLNTQLKQVNEIPRLYRKTNRSIPIRPCSYVETLEITLKEFNNTASKSLDNEFLVSLYEALFSSLTVSYYKYVQDVLTSVQKTEESLRRLKKIREMSSPRGSESFGITDDDKIRLQLNVDVISYGKIAESMQVNVNSVKKFNELYELVMETVKNKDIK